MNNCRCSSIKHRSKYSKCYCDGGKCYRREDEL